MIIWILPFSPKYHIKSSSIRKLKKKRRDKESRDKKSLWTHSVNKKALLGWLEIRDKFTILGARTRTRRHLKHTRVESQLCLTKTVHRPTRITREFAVNLSLFIQMGILFFFYNRKHKHGAAYMCVLKRLDLLWLHSQFAFIFEAMCCA